MHDVVIVGIPLLAILAGILFNRSDSKDIRSEIKDVRSEIKDLRSEMRARFDMVDAELRYFHGAIGKL